MISVIITTVNDPRVQSTVRSIRATSDEKAVEVIVVDDASANRVFCDAADKVIHNRFRCGCGPSRHIGALHASMPWVLYVDAHMSFPGGWFEAAKAVMDSHQAEDSQKGIWCFPCAVLDRLHPTLATSKVTYWNAATINVYGPDRKFPKQKQVLECHWTDQKFANNEVACVLGASYLMKRDWFLHLSPLRYLRSWGSDEIMLSVKNYLFGGRNYVIPGPAIAHYFYSEDERQGFKVKSGHTLWNKMFACHTLLSPEMAGLLIARMRLCYDRGDYNRALEMIQESWSLVEIERTRNQALQQFTFEQYLERFGIPLPAKEA